MKYKFEIIILTIIWFLELGTWNNFNPTNLSSIEKETINLGIVHNFTESSEILE